MTEPNQKPSPNRSQRTVVIVAVAVLIVVAIAGIVLAGRKPAEPAVAVAPTLPVTPAASGTTPIAASAPTDEVPKAVKFAAGSDKLPPGASEGLARFAEAARSGASAVRLSARFYTGENKARDQELAKARTAAIRHALEADGISPRRMQTDLSEVGLGSQTEDALNRVDLDLQ